MVTYSATLDVHRHVVEFLARLLAVHRRTIGTLKRSRALGRPAKRSSSCAGFREAGCVHRLAQDAGIYQATDYRYLHEAIDVLFALYPAAACDLPVLADVDHLGAGIGVHPRCARIRTFSAADQG